MDIQDLHDLINNDTIAKSFADAGNDTECAIRCMSIAPKKIVSTLLGELGMFNVGAEPADVETVLQTIEAVAEFNPVIKRMLKWIQPGAPGIDFGDTIVRTMLTLPVNNGGIGLSVEQAAPFLAAAEKDEIITPQMVSNAWSTYRE